MKSESPAKKHHFWILFGLAPLFTLIGACTMTSSVGGKIEDKQKEIKSALETLNKKANPKPKSLISEAEAALAEVGKKKDKLHSFNWSRQKALYTWPAGSPNKLKPIEKLNLKFGDALPQSENEFDEFREPTIYLNEYSSLRGKDVKKDAKGTGMADRVSPTQFLGGWQARLRYVTEWKDGAIDPNEVWLAMEDMWVQRSLLSAIKAVNDDSAAFRRAKREEPRADDPKDRPVPRGYSVDPSYDEVGNKYDATGKRVPTPDAEKTKAAFRSRTWAVELEVVTEGTARRLTGKLVNLTDKLQLFGNGNTLRLKVWFSKAPTAQPLDFDIRGEYLAGFGATKRENGIDVLANEMAVVPLDGHFIGPTLQGTDFEIARVEQEFDVRTVPIKRIDGLALGYLDSRSAAATLKQPEFIKEAPVDPNVGMVPMGMVPMGMVPMGIGPVGAGPVGAGPGGGGAGAAPAAGGAVVGPLTNKQLLEFTKKRYLDITKEVRRMPVAIVLVVDQSYIQDVLLAFSNSPLRFQITQLSWTRFRGALAGIGPAGGGTGPGGGEEVSRGNFGFSGGFDPDAGRQPGSSSFGPMGPIGPVGPMGPGPLGPPGGMGSGFEGGSSSGGAVSESQITSGLVELSIYGIVSLYEKYVDPKEAEAAAKEKENKEKEKEKEKGANPPMPADPKNGKMRRRAGR
jgi:hypothetical protein